MEEYTFSNTNFGERNFGKKFYREKFQRDNPGETKLKRDKTTERHTSEKQNYRETKL